MDSKKLSYDIQTGWAVTAAVQGMSLLNIHKSASKLDLRKVNSVETYNLV